MLKKFNKEDFILTKDFYLKAIFNINGTWIEGILYTKKLKFSFDDEYILKLKILDYFDDRYIEWDYINEIKFYIILE